MTITSNLAPGYTIGDALKMMDETAKRVLPTDALTDVNGQSREFRQASGGFYLTLALALIFIYLVLSAQFESFADPFVIMLSVPLVGCRRVVCAVGDRRHLEHLQPDWHDHADRVNNEARYLDR